MALALKDFSIVQVAKPRIGEKAPAVVKGDFTVKLPQRGDVRHEWESASF